MKIGAADLTQRVFVIAEIGNNHEGDFKLARDMVQCAAEAGVDAVKFQTIVPDRLVSPSDSKRLAQLERFRFSYDQLGILSEDAQKAGIVFLSTPFDIESVRALTPLVPAFKIASVDNDFLPLLGTVAKTGKPILMSTGLADMDRIRRSKEYIETVWKSDRIDSSLALLHCVVAYPTMATDANLGALTDLAGLGCTVGYSDHTIGTDAAVLSVALGARVIEKHFTMDKNQSDFRDHKLSSDPAEMMALVRGVRQAETLLGAGTKRILSCEQAAEQSVRRAIVAARDLAAGDLLTWSDLTWVRPRNGLAPGEEDSLVGSRLAVDISRGAPILREHLR